MSSSRSGNEADARPPPHPEGLTDFINAIFYCIFPEFANKEIRQQNVKLFLRGPLLWISPIGKTSEYLWANQAGHAIDLETLDVNSAPRYYCAVIKTFRCPDTEALSKGTPVKRFSNFAAVARRKLRQLEIAGRLGDLRVPPGNRLEALKDHRGGQYSIRINDQFRVCFRWTDSGAEDVEIVDYH